MCVCVLGGGGGGGGGGGCCYNNTNLKGISSIAECAGKIGNFATLANVSNGSLGKPHYCVKGAAEP